MAGPVVRSRRDGSEFRLVDDAPRRFVRMGTITLGPYAAATVATSFIDLGLGLAVAGVGLLMAAVVGGFARFVVHEIVVEPTGGTVQVRRSGSRRRQTFPLVALEPIRPVGRSAFARVRLGRATVVIQDSYAPACQSFFRQLVAVAPGLVSFEAFRPSALAHAAVSTRTHTAVFVPPSSQEN